MKRTLGIVLFGVIAAVTLALGWSASNAPTNPQQQYGVNHEQIEKAVEIYNARNG